MTMLKGKDLDPEIKSIDLKCGHHYKDCRAQVTFDVSDGNGGREDLVVEYPMQDDRHLIMLMEKRTGEGTKTETIGIQDIHRLSIVLKDALGRGD
jgi:hypothetical protein